MRIHAKPPIDLQKYHAKERTLLTLYKPHVTRIHNTVPYSTNNKVRMSPSAHL